MERREIPGYLINIVRNYLTNRRISLGKDVSINVSAGVPQGSVLGPLLWNILYDGVLRVGLTDGATTLAYADDLALMVEGKDKEELVYRVNESLRRLSVWMQYNNLDLAIEKTEAVIVKGPRKRDDAEFLLKDQAIVPSKNITYLGVIIDYLGCFGPHIRQVTKKAEDRATKLSRILPNIGGPQTKKRVVLYGVVQSILLYGAPIWYRSLGVNSYRTMMEGCQRRALLRTACAYRTVSTKAIQVIAGVPPIHLLASERKELFGREDGHLPETKRVARDLTIRRWQVEWEDSAETAQWTKRLINDINTWIKCKYRTTNYFLTQALSGHGSFKIFTKKIGKTLDDRCIYCNEEDTPEHTLFLCNRWTEDRTQASLRMDGIRLTPDNMIDNMLKGEQEWNIVAKMIQRIMKKKEEEEREHQRLQIQPHP